MKRIIGLVCSLLFWGTAIADDCLPPQFISLPASLSGSHCFDISFDFDAQLNPLDDPGNSVTFTTNMGSIDPSTGDWIYTPSIDDVITPPTLEVYISNGTCSDTGYVDLTIYNLKPSISCPTGSIVVSSGLPRDTLLVATSEYCEQLSWRILMDDTYGSLIDEQTGMLRIYPYVAGVGQITIEVSDGHKTDTCTVTYEACSCTFNIVELGGNHFILPGKIFEVPIKFLIVPYSGFDLTLAFDNRATNFIDATVGEDFFDCGFEYLTYRFQDNPNCNQSHFCPYDLIKISGQAAINSRDQQGACYSAFSDMISLKFLASYDFDFLCTSPPIWFYWSDCFDNVFYDYYNPEIVYFADGIYDGNKIQYPPNGLDLFDPSQPLPSRHGPNFDQCFSEWTEAYGNIGFINATFDIPCADSVYAPGDINANAKPFEIGDYALFINYFIYGISVFTIDVYFQTWQSNVDDDGVPLTLADLAMFKKILRGDFVKKPTGNYLSTNINNNSGILSLSDPVTFTHLKLAGEVTPELLINKADFTLGYAYDRNENITRVLIYPTDDVDISFTGAFLDIGDAEIKSIELATADAQLVLAKIVPATIELAQNYPNPFNPTTTISFSLPNPMDITFTIYNIKGQTIYEQNGYYEAGITEIIWDASEHASGIYFYRLTTPIGERNKKMILMK